MELCKQTQQVFTLSRAWPLKSGGTVCLEEGPKVPEEFCVALFFLKMKGRLNKIDIPFIQLLIESCHLTLLSLFPADRRGKELNKGSLEACLVRSE